MVENGRVPSELYKFKPINRYLFDLIVNNEMWFSSPKSFNDPFDCRINLNFQNSSQERIDEYFFKYIYEGLDDLAKSHFNRSVPREKFQKILNEISIEIISNIGVGCFMGDKENILMWSHYADSHKGVSLKFDVKNDLEFFSKGGAVQYSNDYPHYDYISEQNRLVDIVVFRKSKVWEYEQEFRVVKQTQGNYKFKKEALKEIIFGSEVNENDVNTIMKIAEASKYPDLKFFKCSKNNDEFELSFEEIGL